MAHTTETTDTFDGFKICFDAFEANSTDSLSWICSTPASIMYFIQSSGGSGVNQANKSRTHRDTG